jgi:hypothetical protein
MEEVYRSRPPDVPRWGESPEDKAALARLGAEAQALSGIQAELLTLQGAPAKPAERWAFNRWLAEVIAIGAGAPAANVHPTAAAIAAGGLCAAAEEFCRVWWRPDQQLHPRACLRLALEPHNLSFQHRLKFPDPRIARGGVDAALALGGGDFTDCLASSVPRIFEGWAPSFAPSWPRIGTTVFVDRWDPVRTFSLENFRALPEIPDGAEFASVRGIADTGATYTMTRYGALWRLTSKALTGDDTGALARPVLVYGSAAFATEDDKFWAMITGNAAMDDGVALFDAAHGNVVSPGTALSAASLTDARKLLLAQTAASGESLRLKAKHLIVPVALSATAAELLVALGNATAEPDDRLTLTCEPRLDAASATAWYLACDPARRPLAEMCFLRGARQPRVTSMWSFNDDALVSKISHVFGCRVVDHRGWVKNPGA